MRRRSAAGKRFLHQQFHPQDCPSYERKVRVAHKNFGGSGIYQLVRQRRLKIVVNLHKLANHEQCRQLLRTCGLRPPRDTTKCLWCLHVFTGRNGTYLEQEGFDLRGLEVADGSRTFPHPPQGDGIRQRRRPEALGQALGCVGEQPQGAEQRSEDGIRPQVALAHDPHDDALHDAPPSLRRSVEEVPPFRRPFESEPRFHQVFFGDSAHCVREANYRDPEHRVISETLLSDRPRREQLPGVMQYEQ
mmetsp:Transcript_64707/g.180052  ORF Transcript_64707/g.180052 Transcript_64707/m.180052 type:complete len:246 (+) Transcript_64707:322-1059(+)